MAENYLLRRFIVVAAFALASLTIYSSNTYSQDQEKLRTLEFREYRKYDVSTEPIAILRRETANRWFQDETQVLGGTEWLRELTFTLENTSDKTIVECELNIIVHPRNDRNASKVVIFGFPSSVILDPAVTDRNEQLRLWKPGQIIRIGIPSGQFRVLDNLRRDGVTDIERAFFAIYRVKFNDGTGWLQGMQTREDPDRPGVMIPVPKKVPTDQPGFQSSCQ